MVTKFIVYLTAFKFPAQSEGTLFCFVKVIFVCLLNVVK